MKINSNKPFPDLPGTPRPLCFTVQHHVRFGECDPMNVMWHGNYAALFELVRDSLGQECGLSYDVLTAQNTVFPIKHFFVDYCKPLLYNNTYTITALLHWTDVARLNMEYFIHDKEGELCTKGFSIQLMVDLSGTLLLDLPPFYRKFLQEWSAGSFAHLQEQAS